MLDKSLLSKTILDDIITDKITWVKHRQIKQPLQSFKDKLIASDRDFYQALTQSECVFILECKKASPSKGLLRADFDVEKIALQYAPYANVISVLCDEKYFQGSLEYIKTVRDVLSQPVLCKDFIINVYQIYLARHYQADAVLLMLSVLDDETYQLLSNTAHRLNMGVLTEISNEVERQRAINLNAKVIGINNRNLRDMSIDLQRTKNLAIDLPKNTIVISESGIQNHSQIVELSQRVQGFLIGSTLMQQSNIDFACRKLIFGENKVCGLTHAQHAADAYKVGAIYGGLIFVTQSPRYINVHQARLVMLGAPLTYVGVFQNEEIKEIISIAKQLHLSVIQLHGNENATYIDSLRHQLPKDCQIWKAHGIGAILPEFQVLNVDKHLLDTRVGKQQGGCGKTFNWDLLKTLPIDKSQCILAGGLTPENASDAAKLGFSGLDFNSGVETCIGIKDPQLLAKAFSQLKKYK